MYKFVKRSDCTWLVKTKDGKEFDLGYYRCGVFGGLCATLVTPHRYHEPLSEEDAQKWLIEQYEQAQPR